MRARTSTWDIVRLAWYLWRNPYRSHLRIGQTISNAVGDCFYPENEKLIAKLRLARLQIKETAP